MGYGSYSYMPISQSLALSWFLGTVVEFVAGGLLVGWILSGVNIGFTVVAGNVSKEFQIGNNEKK